jgi:hypothetical protein
MGNIGLIFPQVGNLAELIESNNCSVLQPTKLFGGCRLPRWFRSGLPGVRSINFHLSTLALGSTHAKATTRKPALWLKSARVELLRQAERQWLA